MLYGNERDGDLWHLVGMRNDVTVAVTVTHASPAGAFRRYSPTIYSEGNGG